MPITGLTFEEARKLADGHTCGVCGGRVNAAWSASTDSYMVRCGQDINHTGVTRHNRKHESEVQIVKEARKLDSKSLMVMPESQMLARVEMAKFPQELTLADKKLLAQVAVTYGFDPLMGEVTIYQGRPFVSIDGRYRAAQETGELDGVETRPAFKEERETWQIPDADYFFRAEVWRKGCSRPFVGWGRVFGKETSGGKGFRPVETNPQRMAEKRAEAQALRKAFHIPLPSAEDIGVEEAPPRVKVVDVTTGEIMQPVESSPAARTAPPAPDKPLTAKRDPATIKSIAELCKALSDDFHMDNKSAWAELNIKSWPELTLLPSEAYILIRQVKAGPPA